jgi:hypothetical protein
MPLLSAEQWAAARVIYETTPTKGKVLAAVMATTDRTIRRYAKKEGWVRYRPAMPGMNAAPGSGVASEPSAWSAATGASASGAAPGTSAWCAGTGFSASGDAGAIGVADAAAGDADGALPQGEDLSLDDVRRRLAEVLPRQLAQILTLAERGIVDKGRIDALLSMGRVLERSETLAAEQARETQKRSDEELAAMLERIDERIIELAEAYAERLVGRERERAAG